MIKREQYMSRIRPFIGGELVKVITGMRRAGKSVMLELIKDELRGMGVSDGQMISYNFEDLRHARLLDAMSLHDEILRRCEALSGKVYLFLDEIQEVEQWEKCVNSLRVALDCDIYVTGSNAKLLSGELATYLAGRYVEFVVYPFSFAEFLSLLRTEKPAISREEAFRLYLLRGGMPHLSALHYEEAPSRQYLQDLFQAVQLKDVIARNRIRDVDLLSRLIEYVIANAGSLLSAHSLVRFFKSENRKVSVDTVLNYLRYGCDAFLFHRVKREDLQGKQILAAAEKYYIADHGIREALYGTNQRDINLVLENIVFLECLRRGYAVTVGRAGEKEVDFVCERQGERLYIQVAYLLADEATVRREFGAYDGVKDNFPKYVLSLDGFDLSRDGIRHQNLIAWLLSDG